jgi:methyl-accepting chemotaxis protein
MERATRMLRTLAGDLPRLATEVATLGPVADDVGAHALTLERLARQTTQLALNASIEAQRAGPFGIGFGVVADEMQRLAAENAHTTARLTQCISAVRDGVHLVATRLERSGADAADVDEVIAQSRQALDALQRDVAQVVERADAAMRQARVQADGSASALIAADGLDERTQRAVLEARRTAQLLSAHATDLHALQQAMQQLESARPRAERAAPKATPTALTPTRRAADAPRTGGAPGDVRDVA